MPSQQTQPLQETVFTETNHSKPLTNKNHEYSHRGLDQVALHRMPTFMQSKVSLHTRINGRSKPVSRTSPISEPGTNRTVKESCSASTSSMKVARSRLQDS